MNAENNHLYQALLSHDARFDGVFYVGVTSTGIYCRPVCRVKTPKEENCRFFDHREIAEKAGFRPCLRCRPELAPGSAPIDDAQRIAYLIAQRIEEGLIDIHTNIEDIAEQFQLSSRQIRRIVQKELGVSPIELMQTRRLLLAKQLLTETTLSITEIAFASGFASLRRFNDAFLSQYRMPPSHLRKSLRETHQINSSIDAFTVQLLYRPPYDWEGILDFLRIRMLKEVEWVTENTYYRTVDIDQRQGWISVTHHPKKNALQVTCSHSLLSVLPVLLNRLRNLFDLTAFPDLINTQLSKDPLLTPMVAKNPGLRVPGCFDGFELAIRAILGQQITVKAATTLSCRLAEAFGKKIQTPYPALSRLTPISAMIAQARIEDIARLGIVRNRAKSMIALAQALQANTLALNKSVNPEKTIAQLMTLPGIGPWTAHYITMRALRWSDAFPKEDIALRNNLGGISAKEVESMAQMWRPWRSYALLHIWRNQALIDQALPNGS